MAVLSGVVHHPYPSYKVNHLLAGGVVQVVAALVTPVPVHPLQPKLATGSCPIRHDKPTPRDPRCPARRLCPLRGLGCSGPARAQGTAPGADFRGDAQAQPSTPAATIIRCCGRRAAAAAGVQPQDPAGRPDSFPRGQAALGAPAPARTPHCTWGLRPAGVVLPWVTPPLKSEICISRHGLPSSPSLRCAGGFAAGGGIYSVTGLI